MNKKLEKTPLLDCRQITKSYSQGNFFSRHAPVSVLAGVDLRLDEGESLGLLGKNGCGKSTLSRLILGLEKPDSGEIFYRGVPIGSMSAAEYRVFRREVQVVFQDSHSAVNGRLKIFDTLAEPLKNFYSTKKSQLKKRIGELLTMVGLEPENADKFPHQFSGGQLQRICIARALATEPRLLVLDESVNSLDMAVQTQTLSLLEKLKKERQLTCILISHDLRAVFHLCSRVLILDGGVIAEELRQEDGYEAGKNPVYRELLNAIL